MEIQYKTVAEPPQIPEDSDLLTTCYLCGKRNDLTEEHVIPIVLFNPNHTNHYVKLFACNVCNKAKGRHDEYMTRQLQSTSFADESQAGFQRALKGFREGHGKYLRKGMLDRMVKMEIFTKGGLFLENVHGLKIETQKMQDFILPIAKGLLVRNTLRLYNWTEYDAHYGFDQLLQSRKYYNDEPWRSVWKNGKWGQYWQNIFSYKGSSVEEQDTASMWTMMFYSSHIAVVVLMKKGLL
jgi:hypothetical protein